MCKSNKYYRVLIILLFLGIVAFGRHVFAADGTIIPKQKTYVFHTALQTPIKEILTSRIQEAFKRLNLNAKILINSSSQRALMLANEEGDGDAYRVYDLKKIAAEDTGNLLRVPESIITVNLAVYSKKLSFPVEGWHSLEKYHNGARMGAKILEKNIPGKPTFLKSTEQLVKMLDSDRIDTMVEWDLIADHTIQKLKVQQVNKLSPYIKAQPFYIYLHKKHREIIPELSKVLRQMKKDGFFNKIDNEYVFYTGTQSPMKDISGGRLQEAFKRIGLKFKLVSPGSSQRALIMANEDGDGEVNRVPNIKQIAPKDTGNLMQIPESINTFKFCVYTKGTVLSGNGYESLANLRNGLRVGTKILEKNIPGERVILPDATRLFQMLYDGRLDTVVALSFVGDKIIKENNYSGITKITQPLVNVPAFSYIHKKHQVLIPEIVQALKEMKADGTFEKIEKEALKEFNLN